MPVADLTTRYRVFPRLAADGDAGANRYEAVIRLSSVRGFSDLLPLRRCLSAFLAASNSDRLRTPTVGSGRLSASTCHAFVPVRSPFEPGRSDGLEFPLPDTATTVTLGPPPTSYG